jgi:transposase
VGTAPWIVSDELWDRVKPLLPQRGRRFRYPGRKPLPDRAVLCGILYVLHTGIQLDLPTAEQAAPRRMFTSCTVRHRFLR